MSRMAAGSATTEAPPEKRVASPARSQGRVAGVNLTHPSPTN